MFTGIVTNLGKIAKITDKKLVIKTDHKFLSKIKKGDSISLNGICLTVVRIGKTYFEVDFMPETAKRTNLKYAHQSDLVNLELPVTPNSFLSGHIVQGHIDEVSKLLKLTKQNNSYILKFSISQSLSKFIVEKGAIAINGISLTIIEAKKNYFTVGIIPYTLSYTMLHTLTLGDFVNIEVDILAKYLQK